MRLRKLRIAWLVAGLATVLLMALWAGSYWYGGAVCKCSPMKMVGIRLQYGEISAFEWRGPFVATIPSTGWHIQSGSGNADRLTFASSLVPHLNDQTISIPLWLFTVLPIVFAAYPIGWRFSLRTLLIATTLVAVVLGLAVYAARN